MARWPRFFLITAGSGVLLLAPLYFIAIGAPSNPGAVTTISHFLPALLAAAYFGKPIGAGLPAGLSSRDAWAVGFVTSGRGGVELAILSIVFAAGPFDPPDGLVSSSFSVLVIVAAVGTMRDARPLCFVIAPALAA